MRDGPRAGVIGWPAGHSRSPLIHNHWLETLGLPGRYERVAVPPERFADFVRGLAARGWRGANVTVPHKEAALALVEEADETARAIGAVNTLWLEGDRLIGSNTDAEGFLANLDEASPGWAGRSGTSVVLGAGGAARAVVHALRSRGVPEILLVNRTVERAESLARRFGPTVRVAAWDALPEVLAAAGLLVNATSLGMAGKAALTIDLGPLRPQALVTDLVYVPLETPLLAEARRRGHPVVDGLGMLLHQAVPGFERWFGRRPQVTPDLRRIVEDDVREQERARPASE